MRYYISNKYGNFSTKFVIVYWIGGREIQFPNVLDAVDRAIIDIVSNDGRLKNVDIARRIGVSEGTVRNRIERMVDSGALRFIGVVDAFQTGLRAMALVGLRTDLRLVDEIAKAVAQFQEVRFVVVCSGSFEIIIEVWAESNDVLLEFISEKLRNIDGILEVQVSLEMKLYKNSFHFNRGDRSS